MAQTFTHEGRQYEVTHSTANEGALAADLISRGFDGRYYIDISRPVGRQRKTFQGGFFRTPAGRFVAVL